jgi:hypothetical protein
MPGIVVRADFLHVQQRLGLEIAEEATQRLILIPIDHPYVFTVVIVNTEVATIAMKAVSARIAEIFPAYRDAIFVFI